MATINYSINPEPGYEGDYNIEAYKKSAPTVKVGETPEPFPHDNPMTGSITVPSSEPYWIRVRAVACDTIVGEFSVEPPTPECPAPGAVSFYAITDDTATASFIAASSVPANGYDWRLVRLDGITEVPVTSGNTSSLSVNLTGLIASNQYRFYVKSKCGSSTYSNESYNEFTTTGEGGTIHAHFWSQNIEHSGAYDIEVQVGSVEILPTQPCPADAAQLLSPSSVDVTGMTDVTVEAFISGITVTTAYLTVNGHDYLATSVSGGDCVFEHVDLTQGGDGVTIQFAIHTS